ncbi:MAG: ribosome biogenesis GTPase Der [Thermoguttaceae bacterium]
MGLQQVVIVGRPNVGKSTLFNWLVGHRIAIVDPAAGVTRDRVTHLVQLYDRFLARDRFIELVDTGGMGVEDPDKLTEQIQQQIDMALEMADLILMVVDTRAGLVSLDEEVARRLRYVSVPVLCVANKTDTPALEPQANEFYRLGRKVILVSAEQKRGKAELVDAICERLPPPMGEEVFVEEPLMKLAIVGRRNVGKSTFVNTLAQAERMIVSEVPGTTRDSVDVRFELDGKAFVAIDTPGFRRRQQVYTSVDFYSTQRAHRSIRRADVVLLFFDASQRVTKVDKQLCEAVAQQYKPCVFVVNKWDLVAETISMERWVSYLRDTFRTMWHVPIAFIVGKTGKNVKALLEHTQVLFAQARSRVPTADLNRLIRAALERTPPPLSAGRRPKIYYATQVAIQPPTIVMFCNDPHAISPQYRRYLLGVLRDRFPFAEVPIKLYLRKREPTDLRDEINGKLG